jgi:hypothetical protein
MIWNQRNLEQEINKLYRELRLILKSGRRVSSTKLQRLIALENRLDDCCRLKGGERRK